MNFKVMQFCIIKCIIRSECVTDALKIVILSYLYFNLCWDFPYYKLCSGIEDCVVDWINYDFLQGESDVSKS